MAFLWSWKQLTGIFIEWDSVIDFHFYFLSHIVQLDPIFARFCNLGHPIFLGIYFFPNSLLGITILQIPSFDHLQLRPNPNSRWTHKFLDAYISHFDIADLDWSFILGLFFFSFFLIFCSFLCFLKFISLSSFHLFFCLLPHEGFDYKHFILLCLLLFVHLSFLLFIFSFHLLRWVQIFLTLNTLLLGVHLRALSFPNCLYFM